MIDSHVEKLHYEVSTKEQIDYDKAAPLEEETDDFIMTLHGNTAVFLMKTHFATEQEARTVVDGYLKKWAVLIGIEHDPDELVLSFKKSDIIDRCPRPRRKGDVTIHCKGGVMAASGMKATLHVSRARYPSLPRQFSLSPDVETMYLRYRAYSQGRETLTTMANVCLTVLQASTRSKNKQREKAALQYNIDLEILRKLGQLCAKGSVLEARKAPKKGPFILLASQERQWIEQAVKAIIRRVGEWAYDPKADLSLLTMADFPFIA